MATTGCAAHADYIVVVTICFQFVAACISRPIGSGETLRGSQLDPELCSGSSLFARSDLRAFGPTVLTSDKI